MPNSTTNTDINNTKSDEVTLLPESEQRVTIPALKSSVFIPAPEQRVLITPSKTMPCPLTTSKQTNTDTDFPAPVLPDSTIATSSTHPHTLAGTQQETAGNSNKPQQNTSSLLEAIITPNTAITAQHHSRRNNVRPPLPTDRITRLNGQRNQKMASALHTSSTLHLGHPLKYQSAKSEPNTVQWQQAEGEEIQRLLDTATIKAIHPANQPIERRGKSTYYNPQVKEKSVDGATTYRVRGTVRGDRINYPGPTTARTAAMPLVKLLLQSIVSDYSRFLTLDIKGFYLNTPLDRPEFLRISSKFLPHYIVAQNSLQQYLHNGSILFEVNKGMYGLPQAGLLAQNRLIEHLAAHGYHQTTTTCLFRHVDNGTDFILVVDDFGVKYATKEGVLHLIDTLQKLYVITIDWTGSKYLGFTIILNYNDQYVDVSMPGYIDKVLQRFATQQCCITCSIYTTYGTPD